MARGREWTKEEEHVLVQLISEYPYNLLKAFTKASEQLDNRSVHACRLHWYMVLSPKKTPTKVGVTFMSMSSKAICKNRKNSSEKVENNTLWTKIKKLLKLN